MHEYCSNNNVVIPPISNQNNETQDSTFFDKQYSYMYMYNTWYTLNNILWVDL